MATSTAACSFKFILIGSSGVGKTALLKRLVDDYFSQDTRPTIGVEFDSTFLDVDDQCVKLQIWDTVGQERFRSITRPYFRNAVGVILAFDICELKSFEDVSQWLNEVHSLCDPTPVVILVGNKSDLASSREVTMAQAEEFAQHHHIMYIETSAKSGDNVREAFLRCATQIYRTSPKAKPTPRVEPVTRKKKGCCG